MVVKSKEVTLDMVNSKRFGAVDTSHGTPTKNWQEEAYDQFRVNLMNMELMMSQQVICGLIELYVGCP